MDLVHEFAEDTTFHGVKDFRRLKSRWALVLWTVIVIACISVMVYEMYMIASQYKNNPTATQVTPYFLESYPYPRILFCPNEWINETKVAQHNISKPLLIYALSLLQDVVLAKDEKENFTASNHSLEKLDAALRKFLKSQNFSTYVDFYRLIANEPSTVSRCNKCDYTRKHVVASGVCIQIRLSPASSAFLIQSPPAFLYTEPTPDLASAHLVPKYSGMYTTDAMYVSYLPQNEFFLFDPLLLNRNFSYILRIKPTLYQRLNKPQKPCVPPEVYRLSNYSQLMCYAKCDETHKRQCHGCFYLGYNQGLITNGTIADSELPLCSTIIHNPNDPNCTSGGKEFNDCVARCSPRCHEWVYETTLIPISQRKLLTDDNEEDITVAFSYQVRYGETLIKEVSTYTWDTFLSNVGGQLGLWMGASVVSVIQLIHFLALLIYDQCIRGRLEGDAAANGMPKQNDDHTNGNVEMVDKPSLFFVKNVYPNFSQRHTCANIEVGTVQQSGSQKRRTSNKY